MMSRAQVITLQIAAALTVITGVVFAVMKYAMKSDDPFAVANHPLQPSMLSAHVVVAPLLVFAFGWIFGNHIEPGLANRAVPRWKSGLFTAAVIVPMIVSGYLMQIATADPMRNAMTVAHWLSSALFVVAHVMHLLTRKGAVTTN
jgi:hypothetical protein